MTKMFNTYIFVFTFKEIVYPKLPTSFTHSHVDQTRYSWPFLGAFMSFLELDSLSSHMNFIIWKKELRPGYLSSVPALQKKESHEDE